MGECDEEQGEIESLSGGGAHVAQQGGDNFLGALRIRLRLTAAERNFVD